MSNTNETIKHGLHRDMDSIMSDCGFTMTERKITQFFSREWFISTGGRKISYQSTYNYIVLKPTQSWTEFLNLEREIIVLFSIYDTFQARSLDVIDQIIREKGELRIDRICSVLVSNTPGIQKVIKDILKTETSEFKAIVPFEYKEFDSKNSADGHFLRNRFSSYFFTRDLFAFESPLKKDYYFFGRKQSILNIVSRHKSNENSSLFGLRRSGKTSIIYAVDRALRSQNLASTIIDCQNPSFSNRNWREALHYILQQTLRQNSLESKISLRAEDSISDKEISDYFLEVMKIIYGKIGKTLIIFDEIENITFNVSPSKIWREGSDFIMFWQAIRSVFNHGGSLFTFLIVGTNSSCLEASTINGIANPLFGSIQANYLEPFDLEATREMIRKLGRIMGLRFAEEVYSKIMSDFGGHPFLMRHVCSEIHKTAPSKRPVDIKDIDYLSGKRSFDDQKDKYITLILDVLREFYPDEYSMLQYLALGDLDTFNEFALNIPELVSHLINYGIIEKSYSGYGFRIDIVKQHLIQMNRYKRINMSQDEKIIEMTERRTRIEKSLRDQIKKVVIVSVGANKAVEIVKNILTSRAKSDDIEILLNANETDLYFSDLVNIMTYEKNGIDLWVYFSNVYDNLTRDEFKIMMTVLNKHRRTEAHAKNVSESDFLEFRKRASQIEKYIDKFK